VKQTVCERYSTGSAGTTVLIGVTIRSAARRSALLSVLIFVLGELIGELEPAITLNDPSRTPRNSLAIQITKSLSLCTFVQDKDSCRHVGSFYG
jgi:hypothetical protein